MRAVFEKYQRERDEKVMFETLKTAEKIAEMLKQNIDVETFQKKQALVLITLRLFNVKDRNLEHITWLIAPITPLLGALFSFFHSRAVKRAVIRQVFQ
jgi:hypothetical protein